MDRIVTANTPLLPRRGAEVAVDFIGGHPERPIVMGRVFNGVNMPPWDVPANAKQSEFVSRSQDRTPRTANAFMFEHKPGQEEIWLHAERNMRTEVEADEQRSVDGARNTMIGGGDATSIGAARTIHAQGADVLTVGQARSMTVANDESYTVRCPHAALLRRHDAAVQRTDAWGIAVRRHEDAKAASQITVTSTGGGIDMTARRRRPR